MNFPERYAAWCAKHTDAPAHFNHRAAYWMMGTLFGRNIWIRTGSHNVYPNIWMLVIAPSSRFRKSTVLRTAMDMVDEINHELRLPDAWSVESFLALLKERPHGAIVAMEFAGLMSQCQLKYNHGAMSLLTEIYDNPRFYRRRTGTKEVTEYIIDQPCVNILGATTIDWLGASLKEADVAGGFLSRFLLVAADTKGADLPFPPPMDEREREALLTLVRGTLAMRGEVAYSEAAKKQYEDWYGFFMPQGDRAQAMCRGFFPRLATYVHKLAMLNAVMDSTMEIAPAHLRDAISMAEDAVLTVTHVTGFIDRQAWFLKHGDKMLRTLKARGDRDRNDLLRGSHLPASQFKEILDSLVEAGCIERMSDGKLRYIRDLDTNLD